VNLCSLQDYSRKPPRGTYSLKENSELKYGIYARRLEDMRRHEKTPK
jgi:hypothetical protein